ncbi:cytochrome P450 4c3-like isoform X1 [Culex pipiens pallens]|uniref:cytochrome P450 4c3-like isoform X1 n=1 Tax=Culex pipiens pallens TaxID=42434 RepID=UPI0022AB416C|nr:cytochrome P450 4c3-like isoform X1 [Culex pipiens pallens]
MKSLVSVDLLDVHLVAAKIANLLSVLSPVTTIILVMIVGAYVTYRKRQAKLEYHINKLPGPYSLPLIGNGLQVSLGSKDDFLDRVVSAQKMYGRRIGLSRAWNGPFPYVLISKASAAEPILSNPRQVEKSADYDFLKPWLGNGLLTSPASIWHPRRKTLTPAFHFKILSDFIPIFHRNALILAEKLEEQLGNRTGFDVVPLTTLCALDVFCETAMGIPVNAQRNSDSEYVRAHQLIGKIIRNRVQKFWLQPDAIFKLTDEYRKHQECLQVLHSFSDRVIRDRHESLLKRRQTTDLNNNNADDDQPFRRKQLAFLDLLIEGSLDGNGLTLLDVREEVDTFVIGGHDTTAAAMAWLLLLLGTDQTIQDRCFAEIDQIMGGNRDRMPTLHELNEMKYLELCLKETLRLYPSIPMIARKLAEDVKIHNQYTIPAGTNVMIVVYQLHRDPAVFPNPDKFNPDNFLPENSAGRHPYAYIPFSAGARNCIGQKFAVLEEKTVLSTILRKFRIEAIERREDVSLLGDLVLRPRDGLRIRVSRRL